MCVIARYFLDQKLSGQQLKFRPRWTDFTSPHRVLGRGLPAWAKTADETTDNYKSNKEIWLMTGQAEKKLPVEIHFLLPREVDLGDIGGPVRG
jgi:hypothetical protein